MVIENIPKSSPAYCEEIFGPVFSLFKFKAGGEAALIANDSPYGLSAAIFT
jgi:acyl-CoA reductase-like NAD-dependent aldehyde dehydrogenase